MPTATVNGTELYHEVRGTGPPVLLIMGSTGDGGHFDALAALRERLRVTANTLFAVELGTFELYLPDDAALGAVAAPVSLLVSEDSVPVFAEIAHRLGDRLGVDVASTPGGHDVYHQFPGALAAAVRPLLR